jgi:cobalt-zinc-cadmium efflux system membrane fusion protein
MKWTCAALLVAAAIAIGCSRERAGSEDHAHAAGEAEHGHGDGSAGASRAVAAIERGPHGGWLFREADLQFELDIEEQTGPPRFVGHLYDATGRDLPAAGSTLGVDLERFGGRRESMAFRAQGSRFETASEAAEPHSFRVTITLARSGRTYRWQHEQAEFRVVLTPEAVRAAEIEVDAAGPRAIEVRVDAPGEVHLNGERVLQVRPRFAGIVRSLDKRLGDAVAKDDLLGVIQSNESLTEYELRAAMAGTVVSRDVAPGAAVDREDVLFTIADLNTVWIDFAIYPQHIGLVRRGHSAVIRSRSGPSRTAVGTVSYVGPLLEQDTRVSYGRVVLPNHGGEWQPGVYVTASITVDTADAAVAVPEESIVRSQFGPAVFRADGASFEIQPVHVGRTDGAFTEIVAGLEPGARIVTKNTFLLKAELGKSEATHDH